MQNVHAITYIGNRPAWLLDYMLRDVGTVRVVLRRFWFPTTTTDAQRYGTVPLNFSLDRTTLGSPLNQAAWRDCSAYAPRLQSGNSREGVDVSYRQEKCGNLYSTIKDEKTD